MRQRRGDGVSEWAEERAAIAEFDGGMSRGEAEMFAQYRLSQCDRHQAPQDWDKVNRNWRRIAAKKYGQGGAQKAHKLLKEMHEAESFKDLTIAEIEASIDRMNE